MEKDKRQIIEKVHNMSCQIFYSITNQIFEIFIYKEY